MGSEGLPKRRGLPNWGVLRTKGATLPAEQVSSYIYVYIYEETFSGFTLWARPKRFFLPPSPPSSQLLLLRDGLPHPVASPSPPPLTALWQSEERGAMHLSSWPPSVAKRRTLRYRKGGGAAGGGKGGGDRKKSSGRKPKKNKQIAYFHI
nr:hypothetical protein [Morchella crassipes]